MATTFHSSDHVDHFDSTVLARHVADDLSSIFGEDRRLRETIDDLAPVKAAVAPSASRKPLMALIGVGALAVMVTGGLIAGNEATGGTPAPAYRTQIATPAPTPVQPVVALAAATPPAPAETMAAEPFAGAEREAPAAPSRLVRARDVGGDVRRPEVALPAPARPFDATDEALVPTVVVPARRLTCDDRGDCPDTPLLAADRQVADAYNDAIGAGVRNRDLRDYRAEWIRARTRAAGDPQGALRIYGMVAADLTTLAQEAAARPTMAWR
ncbi:hypothetical protein GGQ80_001108 [Sphingomonas jinjuensis]|uniref:Uncharacterized protein n=1 Tax=Sphingomonas jinjuensis TaxID=535907 RepID=A0A840F5N5_9SPHN|nr:hypothetical protein [Sphingomonas jinjuensis]MBB4153220.1 hypothetical protein [Sphingomonas jinjuensis]